MNSKQTVLPNMLKNSEINNKTSIPNITKGKQINKIIINITYKIIISTK